jgi:hypothetical protein
MNFKRIIKNIKISDKITDLADCFSTCPLIYSGRMIAYKFHQ